MPHIRFNWVDILFAILLIRISYIGFKNGLLPEFFRLGGLGCAFLLSFNNYTLVANFLSNRAHWTGSRPNVIAFLLIFFGILFIFRILARFIAMALGTENIPGLSRGLGFLLGVGRGVLWAGLIYLLLVNSPFGYIQKSACEKSFSGPYVSKVAPLVYRNIVTFYPWKKIDTPLVRLLNRTK